MLDLFSDDRAHEDWWMREIQRHLDQGPAHYMHKFPRKPMTDFPSDVSPLLDAP